MKDGHVAEARVRPIDGISLELRYEWDGDLRVSQMFKAWAELEATATEKRQELEAGLALRDGVVRSSASVTSAEVVSRQLIRRA